MPNNLYQKFLTRYPLLWNTRAFFMIPALLLLHLLFYGTGFFSIRSLADLDNFNVYNDSDIWGISVMISVVTLVLWLIFYLRNNAFKSFYPLKKGYLLSEFLLLILIVFLAISFPFTHQKGKEKSVARITGNMDIVSDINTINLAHHFLPFNYDEFAIEESCDTIREYGEHSDRYIPDSLPREHSYLHYCGQMIYSYRKGVLDRYALDAVAKRWLCEGRKDSVTAVINDFLVLVRQYGGSYRFDVDEHVRNIFATPRFLVTGVIPTVISNGPTDYITPYVVNEPFSNLSNIYLRDRSSDLLLSLSYFAVCFALLIFSFRITRLRTWFTALIVLGVYLILFSLSMAMGASHNSEGAGIFFVFVSLGCLVFSVYSIRTRTCKLYAGITFLIFTWTLPSLLPILGAIREVGTYNEHYNTDRLGAWLYDHWSEFMVINLLTVLIIIALLLIPLARKWQACPEE